MAAKTYGLDKKQIALCDAMIAKYPKGIRTNNVVSSASTLVSFYNSKDEPVSCCSVNTSVFSAQLINYI